MENVSVSIPSAADWLSVSAEAALVCTAAVLLVLKVLLPARAEKFLNALAVLGLCAMLALPLAGLSGEKEASFFNMLFPLPSFELFALACAIFTSLMAFRYFSKDKALARAEFFCVLMICTASMMLFARSINLFVTFVSLECMTICMYILSAWSRRSAPSLEAAVKFLIVGGVSGAMILMGLAFIYGAGLSCGEDFMYYANFADGLNSKLFCFGLVFVFAGLLFKLGAFPFQFWMPDVYQGSPTPVSAFLAVASKAAAAVVIFIMIMSMRTYSEKFVLALSVFAAVTVIIGNFTALTQSNIKRLMALSGVSNAGYILVLATAAASFALDPERQSACFTVLLFYLVAYMFATYGIFFVVNSFAEEDDSYQNMLDYCGLSKISPAASSTLTINLASLAGIPPTAGFFGKLLVILMAWFAGLYWLVGVMIVGSAASIYYYFVWIRTAHAEKKGGEMIFAGLGGSASTVVALAGATLLFGVFIFSSLPAVF